MSRTTADPGAALAGGVVACPGCMPRLARTATRITAWRRGVKRMVASPGRPVGRVSTEWLLYSTGTVLCDPRSPMACDQRPWGTPRHHHRLVHRLEEYPPW